eukprot:TRINITY_DN161_c0_g1_i1.p1 TRINITY_DN161_c0_g1~~TRINITY_DN161_c0_g1_i1.p1  ORF type:complete len:280 (-),score=-18.07 TRINITY_DN161_c0_g1_i1:502-1341(-)
MASFPLPALAILLALTAGLTFADADSVKVVGNVYCERCFHPQLAHRTSFVPLPGVRVAVKCRDFETESESNADGVFEVSLPANIQTVEDCSGRLLQRKGSEKASAQGCTDPFIVNTSNFVLKSKRGNQLIYSGGSLVLRPPANVRGRGSCGALARKANADMPTQLLPPLFPPLFSSPPPPPLLPTIPNPFQPPPSLPIPNPFRPPSLPFPNPFQPPSLPFPNPFQPPSLPFPNPFQPPSLPFPNPLQPPPATSWPFPLPSTPSPLIPPAPQSQSQQTPP